MPVALGPQSEFFEIASHTHQGMVREANEDSCATFVAEDCVGLVVADGVSSFNGGDTASRLAVQVTVDEFVGADPKTRRAKRLYRAVQRANIVVHDRALDVPELCSMATTLTAVVLAGDELIATHIGDCRLYLLREGRLEQLTRDHTVAAERMRLGVLSKANAREHPARSTLTRGLGRELIARVDQVKARLVEGDTLVVVSDGIHGLLVDEEIADLCRVLSAEAACEALVAEANKRGSPDNVTAAVARTIRVPPPSPKRGLGPFLRKILSRPG